MALQSKKDQRWSIVLFVILISMMIIPIAYRVAYVEYFDNSVNKVPSEKQNQASQNSHPFIGNPLISSDGNAPYKNGIISLTLVIILFVIIFGYYIKTANAGYSKIGTGKKKLG